MAIPAMGGRREAMKGTVQVVTHTDDGQEIPKDMGCIEREDLTPAPFGVALVEGKKRLEAIQEVVVEWQMHAYRHRQRHGPHCGTVRRRKGTHHTVFRTVCGALPVDSPRLTHCPCQPHDTQSVSPLATLLPEHTTPALLYVATKWAALTSYGTSVQLFQDVLPLDDPLQPVTIRKHVLPLAERLEDGLGEEQLSCIAGCPRDWGALPSPDGPLTVGIDGGYVKAQGGKQGWCEVIAGKSILAFRRDDELSEPSSTCFAFGQTYDENPKRRLFELLQAQGLHLNQQIEVLSDGGDTVRALQLSLSPEAEPLLDWFHITMRLTTMTQTAKGLPAPPSPEGRTVRDDVLRELERITWFLWHGTVFQALQELRGVEGDLDATAAESAAATAEKLCKAVQELSTYMENKRGFIPNYGERYRHGERISPGFVESTVHYVVSKRMVTQQQMRWSQRGAHLLLQIRTRV